MYITETSTSKGERHYRRRSGVDRRTTRPSAMPIRLGGVFPRFVTPFRIISQSSHTYTDVRLRRAHKKNHNCVSIITRNSKHTHTTQDYVSSISSDMLGAKSNVFAFVCTSECGNLQLWWQWNTRLRVLNTKESQPFANT